MGYINVGAYVGGRRPASKAALKRALADAPETVEFDLTSPFNSVDGPLTGVSIPAGVRLSVVGPDPFTKRSFYGTIALSERTGKITLT